MTYTAGSRVVSLGKLNLKSLKESVIRLRRISSQLSMGRCKNCKHWRPNTDTQGCVCPKMKYGYSQEPRDPDGVRIENDEEWGMMPGPEFGCIHFEEKS